MVFYWRSINLRTKLKKWLAPDRFSHSERVEKVAIELADHYGVDREKAGLAALLHDCGRYVGAGDLIREAKKYKIKISKIEKIQPKLLHAKLGRAVAKAIFGISDKGILSAIEKHTVGGDKMSMLDKIIYIADHIEGARRYKGVKKVRKLAYSNIDKAIIESTSSMMESLIKKGLPVCEQTVKTRNSLILGDPDAKRI